MSVGRAGYHLPTEEGDARWFLDTRMTIKAGGDATAGGFTLLEFSAPEGFAPPLHVHHDEDEGFYVLEGCLHVVCGDDRWSVRRGGFVFLPRQVPHSFLVDGGSVRALQITTPAGFEDFVRELGQPATHRGLPEPSEPDVARLAEVSARHGYGILGPPPASLHPPAPGE
jgi:mannose-6-phosphate isomerase-like protein (cupin superfamily)